MSRTRAKLIRLETYLADPPPPPPKPEEEPPAPMADELLTLTGEEVAMVVRDMAVQSAQMRHTGQLQEGEPWILYAEIAGLISDAREHAPDRWLDLTDELAGLVPEDWMRGGWRRYVGWTGELKPHPREAYRRAGLLDTDGRVADGCFARLDPVTGTVRAVLPLADLHDDGRYWRERGEEIVMAGALIGSGREQ